MMEDRNLGRGHAMPSRSMQAMGQQTWTETDQPRLRAWSSGEAAFARRREIAIPYLMGCLSEDLCSSRVPVRTPNWCSTVLRVATASLMGEPKDGNIPEQIPCPFWPAGIGNLLCAPLAANAAPTILRMSMSRWHANLGESSRPPARLRFARG